MPRRTRPLTFPAGVSSPHDATSYAEQKRLTDLSLQSLTLLSMLLAMSSSASRLAVLTGVMHANGRMQSTQSSSQALGSKPLVKSRESARYCIEPWLRHSSPVSRSSGARSTSKAPLTRQCGGSKTALVLTLTWWDTSSGTIASGRHACPRWNCC